MTEVSFALPRQFEAAADAQPQHDQPQASAGARFVPPRSAVHSNETFVARGTTAADLAALFPK